MTAVAITETHNLRTALQENPIPGLTYRTAARWVEAGLVVADGGGAQGRDLQIGEKQLRELRTLAALRQHLSLQALRRAAGTLHKLGYNPFSTGAFAVLEGGELIRVVDEDTAVALIRQPGQLVALVALDG